MGDRQRAAGKVGQEVFGLPIVLSAALVLSCSRRSDEDFAGEASQARLDAAAIRSSLSGNTARGMTFVHPRVRFLAFFGADGSCKMRLGDSLEEARKAPIARGQWRLTADGTLCSQCIGVAGREACARIRAVRGKFFGYGASGGLSQTFRVEPGDSIGE